MRIRPCLRSIQRRVTPGRLVALALVGLISSASGLLPARSARADVILIVDTTSDAIANDGACSLREAIIAANSNANYFGCVGNGGGFDLMQFDADGDGKLSREEAPERLRELFDQFDTNKDGMLDRSEIRALQDKMRAKYRGGPPAGP